MNWGLGAIAGLFYQTQKAWDRENKCQQNEGQSFIYVFTKLAAIFCDYSTIVLAPLIRVMVLISLKTKIIENTYFLCIDWFYDIFVSWNS